MGDARLSLERLEGRKFGFMLVDAFSSDAIPVHLLTKEAVQLYFDRLEDDGLLALHISNRYLDLEPVVDRIAKELNKELGDMPHGLGVEARVMHDDDESAPGKLIEMLGGPADVVMSDMAANTTGHKKTDHLRIIGLAEAAIYFAREILAPGGAFVAKVFQGGTENQLLADLKRDFAVVRHVKPAASRAGSPSSVSTATSASARSPPASMRPSTASAIDARSSFSMSDRLSAGRRRRVAST